MSSACMHVDYLSHEWDACDVIRTHAQIRKQMRKVVAKRAKPPNDPKELKALIHEQHRLTRYQNALWRQMAKTCTARLGRHNPLVNPSTVNWQKESDITWLYGPLYTQEQTVTPAPPVPAQRNRPSITGLKPVLKKASIRTDTLPHVRRPGSPSMSDDDDDVVDRSASFSSTTTAYTSVSSTSTQVTNSSAVRFSPEITKVQYFLPEFPVRESLGANVAGWHPYFDDGSDDESDDDTVWNIMVGSYDFVKTAVLSRWAKVPPLATLRPATQPRRSATNTTTTPNPTTASLGIIVFCVSVVKNVTSFMAAWLVYQSLYRLVQILQRPTRTIRKERRPSLTMASSSSSSTSSPSSA